jgi:cysteine desulfuration protein SufE
MALAEKEQQLIARYALVEDLHERLAAVVERARKMPPLPESARTEAHRVPGCVSQVWLYGTMREGVCHFHLDADSALVKGLAGLLCELYDGATREEIAAFDTTLLDALRLTATLSPTRQHGLAQVRRAIQHFAATAP